MDYRIAYLRAFCLLVLGIVLVLAISPVSAIFLASFLTPVAGLWLSCCTVAGVCTGCISDPPDGFELEFSGITNGDCAACASYNTVWILDGAPTVSSGNCLWATIPDPKICNSITLDGEDFRIGINITSGGGITTVDVFIEWRCTKALGTDITTSVWTDDFSAGTVDCANLSALNIPWAADNFFGVSCLSATDAPCNGSASTATLTTH